jgi:peptide deformylase
MVEIVQSDNPVLRKISKEILPASITGKDIQKVIFDMNEALNSQYDGVAIAAPQIGLSLRMFIVSWKVFDEKYMSGQIIDPEYESSKKNSNLIFINPIIKKISKDNKLMMEGCLSVRPLYGKTRRSTRVTVEAYDHTGKKFTKSGSGLLAHIFQHEIDHLNGILFIDKAKDIHEVL